MWYSCGNESFILIFCVMTVASYGESSLLYSGDGDPSESYSCFLRCGFALKELKSFKILKTLSGPRNQHCQGNTVRPNYSSTGHLFISFVTQTFMTHCCIFFNDLIRFPDSVPTHYLGIFSVMEKVKTSKE